jgi:hypothetical protein
MKDHRCEGSVRHLEGAVKVQRRQRPVFQRAWLEILFEEALQNQRRVRKHRDYLHSVVLTTTPRQFRRILCCPVAR